MALTATATVHLREYKMKVLNMTDVALVEVSPGNDNLFFTVRVCLLM